MGGKLAKNKKGPDRGKVWVTGIQMLEGPGCHSVCRLWRLRSLADPKSMEESQTWQCALLIPALRRGRQKDPWHLPDSQPNESQVPIRDPASKRKIEDSQGMTPKVDSQIHMHTLACMCAPKYIPPHTVMMILTLLSWRVEMYIHTDIDMGDYVNESS